MYCAPASSASTAYNAISFTVNALASSPDFYLGGFFGVCPVGVVTPALSGCFNWTAPTLTIPLATSTSAISFSYAGGKFDDDKVSGGLHGVGAAVVNALALTMTGTVRREGKTHIARFERGVTVEPTHAVGEAAEEDYGTEIVFTPDPRIFSQTEFDFAILERRFRELAFLNAGIEITLRDLRETGDDIVLIEGIFSGTLAYLFNVYDGRRAFSDIVREAKQRGYTEPDPRDDLSGMDVARKLIILGREMGLTLEMSDVKVESLVPAGLEQGSVQDFLERLPAHDAVMAARFERADAAGKVLRYVGRLTASGEATVGVVECDVRHAFANIALTDNVVRFATTRYSSNPLIVQGPGAGPEVTAGGIFADLLRLSAYLGARL